MDKQEIEWLKNRINEQQPTFLAEAVPVGGKATFVCPVCGKGSGIRSGKPGDGISFKDGHWKCFSCGLWGDTLDLWAMHKRIITPGAKRADGKIELDSKNFVEAVQTAAAELLGMPIDGQPRTGPQAAQTNANTLPAQKAAPQPAPKPQKNYFEYIRQCAERIEEERATDYLDRRGLSLDLAKKYHLGYDPKFEGRGEALIIPTDLKMDEGTCFAYTARIIDGSQRYIKHGPQPFFNKLQVQKDFSPIVVITEGEIDALSVMEAGMPAVALGTAGRAGAFVDAQEEDNPFKPDFVIFTDMDEKGEEAAAILEKGMQKKGFVAVRAKVPNGWKDANEALINEGANVLRDTIKSAVLKQLDSMDTAGGIQDIDAFVDGLGKDCKIYKTGFKTLDGDGEQNPGIFRGGMRPGLYVLGAEPSCGKTTLALQMAENIAKAGNYVLFFSLEMTREELRDRSLSRITLEKFTQGRQHVPSEVDFYRYLEQTQKVPFQYLDPDTIKNERQTFYRQQNCLTALEIREPKGGQHKGHKREILKEAALQYYRDHSQGRLYVLEEAYNDQFKGGLTVMDISNEIQKYSRMINAANGTNDIRPVVVIDYLQLITGDKSDKGEVENVGDTVSRLKRVSRFYKIPILCISSFNRASYNNPTDMRAFRSSGFIEYSADVLLGLELAGLRECVYRIATTKSGYGKMITLWQTRDKIEKGAQEKADKGEDYPILLSVMKNRQGSKNSGAVLDYNPAYNFFKDSTKTGKGIAEDNGINDEIENVNKIGRRNGTNQNNKNNDYEEYTEQGIESANDIDI